MRVIPYVRTRIPVRNPADWAYAEGDVQLQDYLTLVALHGVGYSCCRGVGDVLDDLAAPVSARGGYRRLAERIDAGEADAVAIVEPTDDEAEALAALGCEVIHVYDASPMEVH